MCSVMRTSGMILLVISRICSVVCRFAMIIQNYIDHAPILAPKFLHLVNLLIRQFRNLMILFRSKGEVDMDIGKISWMNLIFL